jgi:hypothetical protein
MRFPASLSNLLLQSTQSHLRVLEFEEVLGVFHDSIRGADPTCGRARRIQHDLEQRRGSGGTPLLQARLQSAAKT